jgi:ArsR family transcriptional regulator, zinc-responsive transcriptional repressor
VSDDADPADVQRPLDNGHVEAESMPERDEGLPQGPSPLAGSGEPDPVLAVSRLAAERVPYELLNLRYYMRMNAYSTRKSGRPLPPAEEQVDLAVEVFRMLADATRLRLLWVLLDGETPVNRLADALAKPQAAVSQHLAKLRMARLVRTRRQGTQVYYRLANDHVRQLIADAIHHAEHAGPGIPAHHQDSVIPAGNSGFPAVQERR